MLNPVAPPPKKGKATLWLRVSLWRDFRAACLKKGVSASAVIERLLTQHRLEWEKTDE